MNEIKLQIKGREQDTYTIHYSCDGFYNGGAYAPAICSIALVNYATKELHTFAMNNYIVQGKSLIESEQLMLKDFVDFETFSKSDFRAVKVIACEAVEKSKKLLKFTLDDGSGENRVILSGIHAYYEPEELVGKTCIVITNLPPRPMMGIKSCGMLISAVYHENGEERLNLLMVDDSIPAGAKLY